MRARCVFYTRPEEGWCAISGKNYDPEALSDETLCGEFVIMRCDSGYRKPTCEACLKALKKGVRND